MMSPQPCDQDPIGQSDTMQDAGQTLDPASA